MQSSDALFASSFSVTQYVRDLCQGLTVAAIWRRFASTLAICRAGRARGLRAERLCGLTAQRIPAGAGLSALAVPFLLQVATRLEEDAPREADFDLGESVVDLVRGLFARGHGSVRPVTDGGRSVVLGRIKSFVDSHLGDHDLSPARIVAANAISVRYLCSSSSTRTPQCVNGCATSGWSAAGETWTIRPAGVRRSSPSQAIGGGGERRSLQPVLPRGLRLLTAGIGMLVVDERLVVMGVRG